MKGKTGKTSRDASGLRKGTETKGGINKWKDE